MKRRSDISILLRMLRELGALAYTMALTIVCGMGGYLSATAIPVFTTVAALAFFGADVGLQYGASALIVIVCALLRGIVHYAEQLSGHYIAFKILAALRGKVFERLRKLAPAKLDDRKKGETVSIVTADIELLETFYAHTIAPVAIAFLTSIVYVLVLTWIHWIFGIIGAFFYIVLGVVIPLWIKGVSADSGERYRSEMGRSGAFFLDSLRGIRETLMFNAGNRRAAAIDEFSEALEKAAKKLKRNEGLSHAISGLAVTAAMISILLAGCGLMQYGSMDISRFIFALVLLASSFGPVLALSSLSTTLAATVSSARRVFLLLDEKPIVDEVPGTADLGSTEAEYQNVGFSYSKRSKLVLHEFSAVIDGSGFTGFVGPSGSGKSTALKLLMRFYDADTGRVLMGGQDVRTTPASLLRSNQTFISQDTVLFNDTLENNIRMGDDHAPIEAVIVAAKKAAIHDFIANLPKGYQTRAGELGERLSAGERQRIALARAFLRDSRMLLLDEPTSNLDVLSEAQILKSLQDHVGDRTVILVSHRSSTTAVCSRIVRFEHRSRHTVARERTDII